jgi:hypothetical protein
MLKTFKYDGAKQYAALVGVLAVMTTCTIGFLIFSKSEISLVFVEIFGMTFLFVPIIGGYSYLKGVLNVFMLQTTTDVQLPSVAYLYYSMPQKNSVVIKERFFAFALFHVVVTVYGVLNVLLIRLIAPESLEFPELFRILESFKPLVTGKTAFENIAAPVLLILSLLLFPYSVLGGVIFANSVSQKYYNQQRINRSFFLTLLLGFLSFLAIISLAFIVGFVTAIIEVIQNSPDRYAAMSVALPFLVIDIVLLATAIIFTALGLRRYDRNLNVE